MAKAIKQINKKELTAAEEQAQAIADIVKAIAENREAIMVSLDILKELHSAGVLDIVKGLLKSKEKVGSIALEQLNQPSMHHMVKNSFNAIEFIGNLDPDQLNLILNGVNHGLDKATNQTNKQEQIGVWGLLKAFRNPEINTSITTLMKFLEGMGEGMENKQVH